MSGQGLTEEQKRKIEENKRRAFALRTEKQSPVKSNSASQQPSGVYSNHASTYISQLPSTNNSCLNIHSPSTGPIYTHNSTSASANKWANKSVVSASQNIAASKEKLMKPSVPILSGKCVFVGNGIFTVEVGYSVPLIQYFKQLRTRNYDATTKLWSFKMEEYDTFMKGVRSFQPDIEIEGLPRWILQTFTPDKKDVDEVPNADLSHVDEKLTQALLPFQRDGVNCAIHHNGRLLIADEMGLGKTLQAICVAGYYRKEWPLLIVSPSSLRYDWAQQICKWLPSIAPCDINVVETGKTSATSGIINIVSYDLLSKKSEELKKKMFKVIIMDESHFMKNGKTVRTTAAMPLLKKAKRVLLLSGTPALSRPNELYSQIIAVSPNLFKFHEFGLRYCNAKQMQWGWDYSSASNMAELQALLEKKIMIRRQKKDVLSQLPPKYRQVIMLDPSSVHKHKDLKTASKIMNNVKLKGLNKRGALLEYFHETCKAKLSAVRDYILDLIEAEKKFLVFAHHKEMLDCIEDGIRSKASQIEYMRIDGSVTSEKRNFFCSKFQTCENYRVAILSITAANAGLNLSAANIVVFAELFWNPGILVQAEDRAHRIGQQDSVNVQYLVAQHTADDYIWPLVQSKLDILSKAGLAKDDFGDTDTKRLTDSTQQTILDIFSTEFIEEAVPDVKTIADDNATPDINVNIEGVLPEKIDVNVTSLSPLTVKISVLPEETKNSAKPRTLRKSAASDWTKKIASKQTIMSSQSSTITQQEKTPSKRQASITSFFDRTPPRKILCLDGFGSVATQHTEECESIVMKKTYDGDNDAHMATQLSDVLESSTTRKPDTVANTGAHGSGGDVCPVTPWLDDDYFASQCLFDDTNEASSLTRDDESANRVSQESKAGNDRSPCMTGWGSKAGNDRSPCVTSQEDKAGYDKSPCVTSEESKAGNDRSPCVTSQESGRSGSTPTVSHDDLLWLQDLDWDDEM